MTEITITLVRSCYPEIDINELENLTCLNLTNQNITKIDNLEIFSNIEELILRGNKISNIENLQLLSKLKYLDLSFNNIDAETLLSSNIILPKSLESINLSGNSCCDDEECLTKFQDLYSHIGIIIGEEPEEINSPNAINENELRLVDSNSNKETNSNDDPYYTNRLDADNILKGIVERKCRLQTMENTFDIDRTVKELDVEFQGALSTMNQISQLNRNSMRNKENIDDEHDHSNDSETARLQYINSLKSEALATLEHVRTTHKSEIISQIENLRHYANSMMKERMDANKIVDNKQPAEDATLSPLIGK